MKYKKFSDYDNYIKEHRQNVKNAFEWLKLTVLPALNLSQTVENKIMRLVLIHDVSKYSTKEYFAYNDYFYGGVRTSEVNEAFNKAWLHHIHNNPHHWQHWILHEDEGNSSALDMPMHYIIEMICDWWAFSWSSNNLYEIFDWYKEHRDKQVMSLNTRMIVDTILDMMKEELDNGK